MYHEVVAYTTGGIAPVGPSGTRGGSSSGSNVTKRLSRFPSVVAPDVLGRRRPSSSRVRQSQEGMDGWRSTASPSRLQPA